MIEDNNFYRVTLLQQITNGYPNGMVGNNPDIIV